jgi:hypothetical protein
MQPKHTYVTAPLFWETNCRNPRCRCDLPENILMECVRTVALRAPIRANLPLFPENRFLELAKGFEPLTL